VLGLVPIFFLQTMASLQILTAIIALAMFYATYTANKKLKVKV